MDALEQFKNHGYAEKLKNNGYAEKLKTQITALSIPHGHKDDLLAFLYDQIVNTWESVQYSLHLKFTPSMHTQLLYMVLYALLIFQCIGYSFSTCVKVPPTTCVWLVVLVLVACCSVWSPLRHHVLQFTIYIWCMCKLNFIIGLTVTSHP